MFEPDAAKLNLWKCLSKSTHACSDIPTWQAWRSCFTDTVLDWRPKNFEFNVPWGQRVVGLLGHQFGTSRVRPRSHSNYVHRPQREKHLWRLVAQSTWLAPCRDLIVWFWYKKWLVILLSFNLKYHNFRSSNCFWEARREKISAFCIAFFFGVLIVVHGLADVSNRSGCCPLEFEGWLESRKLFQPTCMQEARSRSWWIWIFWSTVRSPRKTRNYETTDMLPFCQNISHIVPEYLTNKLPDIPCFEILCYAAASYQPMFWQKDSD